MKKLILSAVLFAALFASCKPEEPEVSQTTKVPEGALVGTFKAPVVEGFECTSSGQQRVAKFNNNWNFLWGSGDKISVLTNQGRKTYLLSSGAGTQTGVFSGTLSGGEQISNRLSYPKDNTTALTSGLVTMTLPTSYLYGDAATFTDIPTLLPSAAVIANNSFQMEHLVGYFAFEISNIPAGSDKFVFEVTNGKKINGSFTADIASGINAFVTTDASSDAERIVTITFNPSTEVSTRCFIVPVPTGTYQFSWTMFAGTSIKGYYEQENDVTVGQGNIKGARVSCSTLGGGETNPEPECAYEAVDLGLPSGVKWANMNLGAESPTEEGLYFTYGSLIGHAKNSNYKGTPANYFSEIGGTGSSYSDCGQDGDPLKDYVSVGRKAGIPLPVQYDAATQMIGGDWRLPSYEDIIELETNCTVSWTTQEGVGGVLLTSKINGNTIFLPATSFIDSNGLWPTYSGVNVAIYGSSTGYKEYLMMSSFNAVGIHFVYENNELKMNMGVSVDRYEAHTIRPVKGTHFVKPRISTPVVSDITTNSAEISVEILYDGGGITECGITYGIISNNEASALATQISDDQFVISLSNLQPGTQYKIRGYAKNSAGETKSTTGTTFTTADVARTGTLNGHEWVDLGLPSGLKWATCNVGATTPEGSGLYFAWGGTQGYTKDESDGHVFNYANCPFQTNASATTDNQVLFTKYIGPYGSRYRDSSATDDDARKTILDLEDDAAHVNWGDSWRMPSDEEQTELITKCNWTKTTQNGVSGYLVTGPNGTTIFLPISAQECAFYWSSSLNIDSRGYCHQARYLTYGLYNNFTLATSRYNGLQVRAVCE